MSDDNKTRVRMVAAFKVQAIAWLTKHQQRTASQPVRTHAPRLLTVWIAVSQRLMDVTILPRLRRIVSESTKRTASLATKMATSTEMSTKLILTTVGAGSFATTRTFRASRKTKCYRRRHTSSSTNVTMHDVRLAGILVTASTHAQTSRTWHTCTSYFCFDTFHASRFACTNRLIVRRPSSLLDFLFCFVFSLFFSELSFVCRWCNTSTHNCRLYRRRHAIIRVFQFFLPIPIPTNTLPFTLLPPFYFCLPLPLGLSRFHLNQILDFIATFFSIPIDPSAYLWSKKEDCCLFSFVLVLPWREFFWMCHV